MRPIPAHRHTISTRLGSLAEPRTLPDFARLSVRYQPQLALATNRVAAVEALIRYDDPVIGHIPARDVLLLAQESGRLMELTEFVIATALNEAATWPPVDGAWIHLAVNLSGSQLLQGSLAERIGRLLQDAGVPADALEIEISEATLAQVPSAARMLPSLKALGVRLCVDDFAAARGALQLLQRAPVDIVKMDRSRIDPIGDEPNGDVTARAILDMGRSMNLAVSAEGVDTLDQLTFLQANGCARAQGYLISRPLDADACARFLDRQVA